MNPVCVPAVIRQKIIVGLVGRGLKALAKVPIYLACCIIFHISAHTYKRLYLLHKLQGQKHQHNFFYLFLYFFISLFLYFILFYFILFFFLFFFFGGGGVTCAHMCPKRPQSKCGRTVNLKRSSP